MSQNWNEDNVLRGAWRRVFARSPIVRQIMEEGKRYVPKYNKDGERAKKDAVEYHCQVADHWVRASVSGKRNVNVDHIVPVIDVHDLGNKARDWNEYKVRLFCEKSNLQRICRECHQKKTNAERAARQLTRDMEALKILDEKVRTTHSIEGVHALGKQVRKYLGKKKPEIVRKRAAELKHMLEMEEND